MLFNPAVVAFSVYSTPVVIAGLWTLIFGLYVTVRVQWSRIGWWHLFFAVTVGVYTLGVGVSYAVTTPELALFWDRVGHIGVAFMPLAFFGTAMEILGCSSRTVIQKRLIFAVAVVHVLLVWFTDLILVDIIPVPWGWFSEYGITGVLFLSVFGVIMAVVLVRYIGEYRQQEYRLDRRRLGWQIAAIIIGATTIIDVLPALGLPVYPIGYIPVTLFASVTGVAIIRYRLVDVTPDLAASSILETLASAVLVVDRRKVIRIANEPAHRVLGRRSPDLVNRTLDEALNHLDVSASLLAPENIPFRDVERTWTLPDGRDVILAISASVLKDTYGRTVGTVLVAHDVARRKRAELELERLALYDDLTGMPNRKLFFDRFDVMIQGAVRDGRSCGLIYFDLNGFKEVNDTYGHQAGDTVLRNSAQRINSTIRDSDTVARIGGDEFVVLCGHLNEPGDLMVIGEKIRRTLTIPMTLELDGRVESITIGASFGVSVFPQDSTDRDELLRIADTKMYAEKRSQS